MLDPSLIAAALDHARQESPKEACGLVVVRRGRYRYVPCANSASNPEEDFAIAGPDYAAVEDSGAVVCVVHSHPSGSPELSDLDRKNMETSRLPWLVVEPKTGTHTYTQPLASKRAALYGRAFEHAKNDCYQFTKDFYALELGLELFSFARTPEWWLHGEDLIMQNFKSQGFVEVPLCNMRVYDGLILKVASPVPNHVAVYVGGNQIAHHIINRLSSKDVYDDFWRKATVCVVRHRSLL